MFRSIRFPTARPLLAIAALFLCSGLVRVALAIEAVPSADTAADQTEAVAAIQLQCEGEPGTEQLLAEIGKRQRQLDEQTRAITDRMAALRVAEAEVSHDLNLLREAEARLDARLAFAATALTDDVGRLVAMYENMKPKEAAALFQTMDPEFAAGFLGHMRPEAAAQILGGLPPEVAYAISVIMAGRNAATNTDS